LTAHDDDREDPVDDRRFPFNEAVVAENQRQSAEDHDHTKGDQVHGLKAFVPRPEDCNLNDTGRYRDGCCDVDVVVLVSPKEQNQREDIEEKLHVLEDRAIVAE